MGREGRLLGSRAILRNILLPCGWGGAEALKGVGEGKLWSVYTVWRKKKRVFFIQEKKNSEKPGWKKVLFFSPGRCHIFRTMAVTKDKFENKATRKSREKNKSLRPWWHRWGRMLPGTHHASGLWMERGFVLFLLLKTDFFYTIFSPPLAPPSSSFPPLPSRSTPFLSLLKKKKK